MRNLALADLTAADLAAMLAENETLFVEWKSGLSFAAAKAITSFANTLGGWLLVGVNDDGSFTDGTDEGWDPVAPSEMVDRVRQCLATHQVDPIPPFAATVREHDGRRIGVVRVYESSDPPHVVGKTGQVFVRGVAEDRRYTARNVETQAALAQLVERGRRGAAAAERRVSASGALGVDAPFVLQHLGWKLGALTDWSPPYGSVSLRAAPVTWERLADWSVSLAGRDAIEAAAITLARGGDQPPERTVNVSALGASVRGEFPLVPGGETIRHPFARVATDCSGVVGAALNFGDWQPAPEATRLTLDGFRNLLIRPVIEAVVSVLSKAEVYGRVMLHLDVANLEQVAEIDEDGVLRSVGGPLPLGGEIALPLGDDDPDVGQLADRWRDDLGRSLGFERLRG